ncbi:hypothetical protein I316_06420 [Kwoniella heveanensis BCC8398]|uniref:Uncharacterized protein n=1 Tax=Kwoniella heveanensis BCC8398 TaxID=1296120 RepID=A0A1B9GL83_9TREE|nr:hypothetical protein I316_06420 [Kwoniella heveanensis BCC8398]
MSFKLPLLPADRETPINEAKVAQTKDAIQEAASHALSALLERGQPELAPTEVLTEGQLCSMADGFRDTLATETDGLAQQALNKSGDFDLVNVTPHWRNVEMGPDLTSAAIFKSCLRFDCDFGSRKTNGSLTSQRTRSVRSNLQWLDTASYPSTRAANPEMSELYKDGETVRGANTLLVTDAVYTALEAAFLRELSTHGLSQSSAQATKMRIEIEDLFCRDIAEESCENIDSLARNCLVQVVGTAFPYSNTGDLRYTGHTEGSVRTVSEDGTAVTLELKKIDFDLETLTEPDGDVDVVDLLGA